MAKIRLVAHMRDGELYRFDPWMNTCNNPTICGGFDSPDVYGNMFLLRFVLSIGLARWVYESTIWASYTISCEKLRP